MGNVYSYGLTDFQAIATGAAVLASGGGGSYHDACAIVQQLADQGYTGTVQVQATDTAGNTATTSHTIQIDTEVQNFRLTAVDDLTSLAAGADAVNAMEALNGVTITGTVEPGSTVTVKWGDMTLPASAVTVGANGVWTATVPASAIPAGQTSVQVTATARDQYDNLSSTLTQNVAIDRIVTPLTRGGGQIGGDGYINAAEAAAGVTLTGTVEANSTVWVRVNNGAPIETTATANGTWSITVPKNRFGRNRQNIW